MGCVNKSSKEFKNLAARNNVADNTLELITHKYWIESGNETLFPTDVYIQAQLGNGNYQESGKAVREIWNREYSSPIELTSKEALELAKRRAAKFFPKSVIYSYKNTKGNFILSVKRPVEKADYSKDDFFKEMDSLGSMRDVKTLKLDIKENQSYGIDKVRQLYNKFNTDRTSVDLANRVFTIAKDLGITVSFNENLSFGKVGRYINDNTITYKKSFLERDIMNDKKAPILLHEVLHAITMYTLSDKTKNWAKPETLQEFKTEMNSLYQDLKNNPILKGERGIVDLYEFVAELGNPVFRAKIQEIDKQNKAKKSFWNRILDAFKSLLGLHTSNTYYQRSMNALEKALDALDIDTYMRYNGIKNPLRKGYNEKEWDFRTLSDDELKSKVSTYTNINSFINTLTGKDLKNELSLIEQENADYDLVNNISEEPKHSGKAVPQDFTFADGVTVQAPFKPNAQQIDALNEMDRFIKSNETSMTLSGYAGTGKTSLMEMIAKKSQRLLKPVVFCATTNKAAAVLNDRVSKAGFKATTLNKTFGISVEVNTNSKTYNARNLVNNLKDVDITPGSTIIIDEASMINEENYKVLNDIAKKFSLKIIYVGDEAQLSPVNEDRISKVFRNGDGKVIRLTQVERTEDNAILKEATDIRNGKPLSGETSINSKGEGVAYILPQHQEAISDVINHYVKGLKKDPNYFRILAYTNKAVSDYNNQVRNLLGYDSPTPQAGEPMTGYANWGYDWRTKSYRFINSESYKVKNTGRPTKVSTTLDNGTSVVMEAIPVTLEDSMGHVDTFNFMDIKSNPQNRQAATMLANEKKRLWGEAKRAYGKQAKAEIYQKINALDSFLFINDNIEDDKHNLLQAKTIDFGYAMTVHKSQGSTFTNVLMDDVDISRASFNSNSVMEDIDMGEAKPIDYNNVDIKDTEDIDLGDLGNVDATSNEPNQAANVKQQLEYVGVSRATDTVTIISNNVKKEGSPLYSNNSIKNEKEASNTTLNITPANNIDKKAAIKGAMANKFIGFADGIAGSSTGKYAQQAGNKANTGSYTSNDVVFVSVPGKRGNEDVRHKQQDKTIAEALKALNAGATLLTDNKTYTENSNYNEGEKRLAKALNNAGATYSEIKKDNQIIGVWTINSNNLRSENSKLKENGTEEYKATDEFRRVQEASRKLSQEQISRMRERLSDEDKRRLGGLLGRQLDTARNGGWYSHRSSLAYTNERKKLNSKFDIGDVNPKLFHDIFEVVRTYLHNGELVDLHDDYSDAKCFITSDGLAGFAIEPDGNLVSVFSLNPEENGGFLYAIKDMIREKGATHLDAYNNKNQPLEMIYEKTLGFHTAATMDYNMEYDHDNIAKNHGNPQVVFMVDHEVAEPKHFDKDSYDAAKQYQLSQLSKDVDGLYSEDGKSPLTIYRGYALMEDREAKSLNETVGKTAIDYDETLKGALYFTSSEEEATDYAKSRTDKSPEPPTAEHPEGNRINRHYTGDYAKVSKFHILSTAKVEHYKDIRDYVKNGRNTTADVIVLDKGTMWADNTEYIVKNPDVIVFDSSFGFRFQAV